MDTGSYKRCGQNKCFFTNIRKYRDHPNTRAYFFYGTDFYLNDLPLPRRKNEEWALLHEESPKNNYLLSFSQIMELFNHTATFKRESDLPLLTQYLTSIEDIENDKYLKSIEMKNRIKLEKGLAPIAYVQSDCRTPSNRDMFVKALMKHIKIDSYGTCEHNRDLPEDLRNPIQSMSSDAFYEFLSQYKFVLTIENALCDDYVTEKLWRNFYTGTVPIVLGSKKINDILPTNKSIINIRDFKNAADLSSFIKNLDKNDSEYETYLGYKQKNGVTNEYLKSLMSNRKWGINNDRIRGNFIDKFECLVCERIHENNEREKNNQESKTYQANKHHYGCPGPVTFSESGALLEDDQVTNDNSDNWKFTYEFAYSQQKVFFEKYLPNNIFNFSNKMLEKDTLEYFKTNVLNKKIDLK